MKARIYDSGAAKKEFLNYVDRFSLYLPTPKNKRKELGHFGTFLGFSFGNGQIVRCCWDECKYGVSNSNLGKYTKIETLPGYVQKWVAKYEKAYNNALKFDTIEAWNEFNKM